MKKLLILGSTGSIGRQALEVVKSSSELSVCGLSANRDWEMLFQQAHELGVESIALADPKSAERAASGFSGSVHSGGNGLVEMIVDSDADLVLNAIVGAAGLPATVATLAEGRQLALANKESLVVGGELVMQLIEAAGGRMVPVDSEHSALFQLAKSEQPGTIDRLVLTASGGPFRGMDKQQLASVTPDQALDHPTWDMGGKISVDSATLMNKGLELIEAHHLFGMPYEQIDVLVHPQSIVHALVQLNDGSTIAHMGYPNMKVPISYALHYPERVDVQLEQLNLAAVGELSFEDPDSDTFKCLKLAREAGSNGGTAPCTLNAANEIAVEAFINGRIGFLDIAETVDSVLQNSEHRPVIDFDTLFEADRLAREGAIEQIEDLVIRKERVSA